MRIVLDGMGSDQRPEPEVLAAVQAGLKWGEEIILTGDEALLAPRLEAARKGIPSGSQAQVRIVHAPEVLEMTDKPAENARRKAQNTMAVGMDLMRAGEADAFVTAGSTGGAMATGLFHLGGFAASNAQG
jgi:glycerol-3-phosphate acyltransferase PlsX